MTFEERLEQAETQPIEYGKLLAFVFIILALILIW